MAAAATVCQEGDNDEDDCDCDGYAGYCGGGEAEGVGVLDGGVGGVVRRDGLDG